MDIHVKQFQDIFKWFVLFCLYVNLLENKKHDLLRFICDVLHLVIWQVCDVRRVVWQVSDVCILLFGRSVMLCVLSFGRSVMLCASCRLAGL